LNKKLKVGITGGIGSGKSEFCKLIEGEGFVVLFADEIAKVLMVNSPDVRAKIIAAFGEGSYKNGTLQKEFLSSTVFSDPEKVKALNSIVHPAVIEASAELMNAILKKHDIVFYEAALIFEANMENLFDYVILVTAPEKTRLQRIMSRDKTDEEKIRLRMQHQMSDDLKLEKADLIIDNDGSIEDLQSKVKFALSILSTIPA
jgi:dephospho-CoA kinase